MEAPSKNKIAKIIKELRKKGFTQKELALKTGLSYSAIISYENAKSEPNSKAMAALEDFFNVSGAYLRGETQEIEPTFQWEDLEIMDGIKENLPDFFNRLESKILTLSDRELKFSDDILIELFQVLNKNDEKIQTLALRLAGLSIHISNSFINCYTRSWPELTEDERIKKACNLALNSYKQALDYISEQIIFQYDFIYLKRFPLNFISLTLVIRSKSHHVLMVQ